MAELSIDNGSATKRRRDPERTREEILQVAGRLLANDGPEGLSVSRVAQLVGVNRGTAYHHFQTREQLLRATVAWVSEKLRREAFGDLKFSEMDDPTAERRPREVLEKLANFTMDYPQYGRVWLTSILNRENPDDDAYWNGYKALIDHFVQSDLAEPGIDAEVHAMLMVVGAILWPVWKRAHNCNSKEERRKLAKRYTDEVLRFSLHGTLRNDRYPDLSPHTEGDNNE